MLLISERIELYSWLAADLLRAVEGAVRDFGGQRYGTVEQVRHLRESAIGDLQLAYAFLGVGLRLGQGGGVGLEAVDQRKAGRIIGAGVDLGARRQLLQSLREAVVGVAQVIRRIHRGQIIQDTQGHGVLLFGRVDLRRVPECAPNVLFPWVACLRVVAVASGPFFGLVVRDFIASRGVSSSGTVRASLL